VRGRQPRRPPVAPLDATRDGQRAPAHQIRRVARTRRERDSLGAKDVPARALYGVFTQRARETWELSGRTPHPALIRAYARVKAAAARANARLGLLPRRWAHAIVWAAARVADGTVADAAVLDPFQAGAGTPTHMNVNEVIANLANERLGGRRGRWVPIHPNNHVNLAQSSNDVTPTAIRLMALELLPALHDELGELARALVRLAHRERAVVKVGRTHLQDAVPITYGQVFTGWVEAVRAAGAALRATEAEISAVGLGGTAVGTGLTAHPRFRLLVVRELSRITGQHLRPAPSAVTAAWSLRPLLACSGALRGLAVDLSKICFDLRLLASGPAAGLGELRLPEVEPGSSIMPGKVNPSVAEAVQMACFQVLANDHAIALAAAAGELELNVMTPLCATNLSESLELLTRATRLLRTRCIAGLRVDRARVSELLARSHAEATALSPYLGYDITAEVVKQAQARSATIRDVVLEHGLIAPRMLARILAPRALTGPHATDRALRRRVQTSPALRDFRNRFLG
jgi:aspartate ammonia-lyase